MQTKVFWSKQRESLGSWRKYFLKSVLLVKRRHFIHENIHRTINNSGKFDTWYNQRFKGISQKVTQEQRWRTGEKRNRLANLSLLWSPTWAPGQTFFVSYSAFSYQRQPSTTLHRTPGSDYQETVMTWYGNYLLNCMCCVCAQSLHLCLTLCNHIECSLPGSSVHGILQARLLEWVAMSSSRGCFQSRNPRLLRLLHCRWLLYHWATG